MPKHHPSDFLVLVSADVVEGILALHSQSELRRLLLGPTLTFGQNNPFANDLALCVFSEHGKIPDPRPHEDIGGLRHFEGFIRLCTTAVRGGQGIGKSTFFYEEYLIAAPQLAVGPSEWRGTDLRGDGDVKY
jgi:hypothetical protein